MTDVTSTGIIVIAMAVAIGAFSKSVTGLGMPLVAIPVMASFLGVETAVVVMAFPTLVSTVWLLWAHRGAAGETRELPVLLATGVVGVVVGTVILQAADPRWLALSLAAVIFGYLGLRLAHPSLALSPRVTRRLSPFIGAVAGVAQGATGISGPVLTTYIHAFGMSPRGFLLATNAIFMVFALAQMVTFIAAGLYEDRVLATLVAVVPVAVVFPAGLALGRRLNPEVFDRLILSLLFLSGLKLVTDALGVT